MPSGVYQYRGDTIDLRGWDYPHPCFNELCSHKISHGHMEDGEIREYYTPIKNGDGEIIGWERMK